jgi:succinyl-CoA synthetase beta subunit
VNPLVVTKAGNVHCLDAKVNIDGNALFVRSGSALCTTRARKTSAKRLAAKFNSQLRRARRQHRLHGERCGLAMGTMDLVKTHGGQPANFLDVGGGASKESVGEAFKIILSDKNVNAVLINIFGGIVSCVNDCRRHHRRCEGGGRERYPLWSASKATIPLRGRPRLAESGLNIIAAKTLVDAAKQVVKAAGGPA